jgi:ribosomal protein L15E
MYRILERGKKNGNPDETELRGRTEEGKKWRTLQKVKNYGAHKKRSQTLHKKYLK